MKLFRLRTSPLENLTFVAMMVAFDAILSLVSALVPFSSLFLMLLAPLTSAAVSLFCKKRYIPLYLISALGIGIAITAWDFMNTLFYLFPSLLAGSLYGFLWRLKAPSSINIFTTSLLSFCLFYVSMTLIRLFLDGVNMIDVLLALINRKGDPYAPTVFPLFIYGYALTQTALSHAFLFSQLKRLGQVEALEGRLPYTYPALALLFAVSSLLTAFLNPKVAYFLLGITIYWSTCSIKLFLPRPKPLAIAAAVLSIFIGILLFAGIYKSMPEQSGLILVNAPMTLVALSGYLNLVQLPKRAD